MTKLPLPKLVLPRTRTQRIGLVLILLFTSAVLLWLLWFPKKLNPSAPVGSWLTLQARTLEHHLGLIGTILPVHQETLAAPFTGLIQDVLVQEGERVTAGQTLIRLNPSQVQIQLRQAQAELLKTQRDLERLRNWDSSPEVSRARRSLHAAKVNLNNAQASLRDTQALFERGIIARMEVDTQTQQVQNQQQNVESTQEELRLLESRGQGEDRAIAEMSLSNAQARYQDLVTQLEQQELNAPFAGFVIPPDISDSNKPVVLQTGLSVNQGAGLLRVVGLDHIQVKAQVSEIDVQQLQMGMQVQVSGDGFQGHVLNGRITSIALQSNMSGGRGVNYDVLVAVDTPPSGLEGIIRLGMSAKLTVTLWRMEQAIAVPAQALQEDPSGNHYVLWRSAPDSPPQALNVIPERAVLQGVQVRGLKAGDIFIPN